MRVGSSNPSIADIIQRVVNDAIEANVDALSLRQRRRFRLGTDIKSDHDRLGSRREQDVGFGNPADSGVHDPQFDSASRHLFHRRSQGFRRALHIGLDDDGEFFDIAFLDLGKQIIETDFRRPGQIGSPLLHRPFLGNLAGDTLVLHNGEDITGRRHSR